MTTKLLSTALLSGLMGATLLTAPVLASDLPSSKLAPVAPFTSFNPWMLRVRGLVVVPNDGSKVYLNGAYLGPAAKTDISNTVVPELDISYFFTPNIAAELILGTTPHTARGAGILAGNKLGTVWLLPPTLTLQYHFTGFGAFKPYIGAGVNYTLFYAEKDGANMSRFRVRDTAGLALQVGFDYMINQNWGFNVDVKKLFLRPVATGFLNGNPANRVKAKLDLDPWLIGVGVTYKF